jgi:hypothetical protein
MAEKKKMEGAQEINFDDAEFFDALDKKVNSAIHEEKAPEIVETKEEVEDSQEEQEEFTDDHAESQADDEVERLKAELREREQTLKDMEPFMPLVERMREDEGLVGTVVDYLKGGGQVPESTEKALDLPEDFVFDGDELKDPNSNSYKALVHLFDKVAESKFKEHDKVSRQRSEAERRRDKIEAERKEFMQRNKVDTDYMKKMDNWAQAHVLSLDDIHYLYNRTNREAKISKATVDDKRKQIEKGERAPKTLAPQGSRTHDVKEDDVIFNAILKQDQGGGLFAGLDSKKE